MPWRYLPLLALGFSLLGAARAEPVGYRLDPTHTSVTWEVLHFGTSTLRSRFASLGGDVEIDRAARRGRVAVEIDVRTLHTGVPVFDARLRERDLFATADHPAAWFVAERLEFDAAGHLQTVTGELTLKGRSIGLTLRAVRFGCYTNPLWRKEVCGGDFEGRLRRSDAGMDVALPFVADEVVLRVQAEGVRQ